MAAAPGRPVHVHLLLNHLPVVGTIVAMALLAFRRSITIPRAFAAPVFAPSLVPAAAMGWTANLGEED